MRGFGRKSQDRGRGASARQFSRDRTRDGERGQVIPLVALGLVAILTIAALGVDVGYWRYQQRQEQSAADSAAIAGATALYYATASPSPAPPNVIVAAQDGVIENMGAAPTPTADPSVSVLVYSPPIAGANIGNTAAVEVKVMKSQPLFFSGIVGKTNQTVSARAVAIQMALANPACFYQLSTVNGITQNGNGSGGVIAGQPPNYCTIDANGPVNVGGADSKFAGINYYGATPNTAGNASLYHNVAAPTTDPCLTIPGCAYLSKQSMASPFPPSGIASTLDGPVLAALGGSLIVSNGINVATTFGPGIYYVRGGINAPVSGVGVTIVNVDGGLTYGGTASVLTAPTTGNTRGVAYFQPSLPAGSAGNAITFHGSTSIWNGLFYAPTAQITGDGKGDTFTQLIVGGVTINGAKSLVIDPTLSGLPLVKQYQSPTHVVLAE